ncbi:MAG TPA: hypothetical protein VGD37_17390 [Kofleriaceae bacterium]
MEPFAALELGRPRVVAPRRIRLPAEAPDGIDLMRALHADPTAAEAVWLCSPAVAARFVDRLAGTNLATEFDVLVGLHDHAEVVIAGHRRQLPDHLATWRRASPGLSARIAM